MEWQPPRLRSNTHSRIINSIRQPKCQPQHMDFPTYIPRYLPFQVPPQMVCNSVLICSICSISVILISSLQSSDANLSYGFQSNYLPYPNQHGAHQPPLPQPPSYGGYGIPGLPGLPYSGPAMPPPLPGMMPHLPTMPTHPQMPQYPRPAAGPSHPDPVVPQAAAAPSLVSEPTAAGIVESPCQAVHVPAEENFFTVSEGRSLGSRCQPVSISGHIKTLTTKRA